MEPIVRNNEGNLTEDVVSVFAEIVGAEGKFPYYDEGLEVLDGFGRMFYVINRKKTSYADVEQVPDFIKQAIPYFVIFIILENVVLWLERKPLMRLNDGITSMSHGMIQQCGRLMFRGAESYVYVYIYEKFRLVEFPWDNAITWYVAAIGIDFCYYWLHRASHEIHIFWAQHQVHHSSEDYNLGVALRQSLLQGWCGFIFYLPLAFFIPPAHFITHQQFNLLYQFWIHTKAVKTLGPFEYILNTPKHHRVHHGSNIYCLDKNYGGVLIIWDRIFGTFAEERDDEDIIYGLVFNQPSFNPLHLQTFYTTYVFKKLGQMRGWKNKLAAVFYGPSWMPGRPRLGDEKDKVKIGPRKKYDVKLPLWCNVYLFAHFVIVLAGFHELAERRTGMNPMIVLGFVIYIIASLTSIGMLFDNRPHACVFELLRCMLLVTAIQRVDFPDIDGRILLVTEVFFLLSGFFWLLRSLNVVQLSTKQKAK